MPSGTDLGLPPAARLKCILLWAQESWGSPRGVAWGSQGPGLDLKLGRCLPRHSLPPPRAQVSAAHTDKASLCGAQLPGGLQPEMETCGFSIKGNLSPFNRPPDSFKSG